MSGPPLQPVVGTTVITTAQKPACRHRGAETGELVPCVECAGQRLKVFSCPIFLRCTVAKHGEGVPMCCRDCRRWEASS